MGANDGHSRPLPEPPIRLRNSIQIPKGILSFVPMAYPYICGFEKEEQQF
jgi:hypothetical protein